MAEKAARPTASSVGTENIMEVVRILPDVLFRCYKAKDGKIYWSLNEGGLAEQFGLTTKQIEGKSLDELFPGGASDALHQHFEDAFAGTPTIFTNEIEGRHFRHFPQPVFDDGGNVKEVVGFIADVTELVQAERALQVANEELEAFTYTASHDFRGPLSSMRLDSMMLMDSLEPGTTEGEAARRIQSSTERLVSLVEGLLALSRAGRSGMKRKSLDFTAATKAMAADIQRRNPDHVVELDIEDHLVVNADPVLAEVVIQNLLENAWKFTMEAKPPRIHVGSGPNGIIEVSDNGAGFENQDSDSIFQAFTRLDHHIQGSGIGLATVRRIVERHGGFIEASGFPGQGASFRFSFGPDEE